MSPFRLAFYGESDIPIKVWRDHAEANATCPRLERCARHGRKLAVVGGGPEIVHDLDELRSWDGDIWGINYMPDWLAERGIASTLFSIDPCAFPSKATKRILASSCHPSMLEGDVQVFDLVWVNPQGFANGCSSVSSAPAISFALGYLDVSFFGCDGSWEQQDHVDRHEGTEKEQLIVRAGGRDYLTRPSYYLQCMELLTLFRTFPDVYRNRSRGLLKAMQDHPDTWEVVGVSEALKASLEARNGKQGLFDSPYIPAAA